MSTPTHKVNSTGVSKKSVAVSLIERQRPSEPFGECLRLCVVLEEMK